MLEGQIFFNRGVHSLFWKCEHFTDETESLKSVFPRMFMCKVECLDISVSVREEQEYFFSQLELNIRKRLGYIFPDCWFDFISFNFMFCKNAVLQGGDAANMTVGGM